MSTSSLSRTASIAAEPVSPEVAPTIITRSLAPAELVVEEPADELQGDVLERQRRPVEELEQVVVVVELDQRDDVGMVERRVGRRDHLGEVVSRDGAGDEGCHDRRSQVGVGVGGGRRCSVGHDDGR